MLDGFTENEPKGTSRAFVFSVMQANQNTAREERAYRVTVRRPFTSTTADKHSPGWQRGSAQSLVPYRRHPQIRPDLHMHPFTRTLSVCMALARSYNCRCAVSPLVSSEAVKRHCSDGGGGRVCARARVCACVQVCPSVSRE